MEFKNADDVSSVCWMLKQADYYRGQNRARIDDLFNGVPPYSDTEVEDNNIAVNCNFLESTRLGHDARSQFSNAFQKPGKFFTCRTEMGPIHKRSKYASIVTNAMNTPMKRSLVYMETLRSQFALDVLHGIGPATWENGDVWCPDPRGVEDLLIPANTHLTFKNLPFFAIMRSFTAPELIKLTRGPNIDKGWNTEVVNSCIEYIDTEASALFGSNYPEVWSPEKIAERVKGDGTYYSGDAVPTIDTFDFYYWSDQGKTEGWRRKIILDDWGGSLQGGTVQWSRNGKLAFSKGKFLYDGGKRVFADTREQLFHCQFADLSAVAPFRYHSVRSLGFLLYGICHLQNRLRCKMQEAVFETLMQLFRVKSMDDVQRALNVQLHNHAFIDETINPIPAQERWQPNVNLAELGLRENASLITQNASAYTQQQNYNGGQNTEKTKFQVMAEMNAMQAMVSAGLGQAYEYQNHQYREIMRRFMKPDSRDADVRAFRAHCLRRGVPEKLLKPEYWEVESERIMGGGNKTLEMTIASQLMEWRDKFDPDPQRKILRDSVLAITDDSARADELVPEQPQISDSIHDTEAVFGTLMTGTAVTPKSGLNSVEVAGKTLQMMANKVQQITQQGGVGTPADVLGLLTAAQYAGAYIQILQQDPQSKQVVKKLSDALGKIMNEVKAFAQRQQEMMKKAQEQQAQQNGHDPKDAAKVQAMLMQAKVKADNSKQSNALKTAQRQIQFEQQMQQDEQRHAADLAKKELEARLSIRTNKLKSAEED